MHALVVLQHPVGTGGSPIVTWLPNQLSVVLSAMEQVSKAVNKQDLSPELLRTHEILNDRASTQKRVLAKEVELLKVNYPGQDAAQTFN